METYIAVERSDGTVAHMAFQGVVRCPQRPTGLGWVQTTDGTWERGASDQNIEAEITRAAAMWRADGVTVISWRRLTQAEHDLFGANRAHRDALEMRPDRSIGYNMPKARELHRHLLRHQRGEQILLLDAQWMRATARGDAAEAARVDAERQVLRDAPNDPRIDAAQMIEELLAVPLLPVPEDRGGRLP